MNTNLPAESFIGLPVPLRSPGRVQLLECVRAYYGIKNTLYVKYFKHQIHLMKHPTAGDDEFKKVNLSNGRLNINGFWLRNNSLRFTDKTVYDCDYLYLYMLTDRIVLTVSPLDLFVMPVETDAER